MFEKKPKLQTLVPAETVLGQYEKLTTAIAAEVGKLPPLIQDRIDAERELQTAEVNAALGEQADVAKASKRVETARAALDQKANLLRGLRDRQAGLGTALTQQQEALAAELPSHAAAVAEAFRVEWQKAVAIFSTVLSKRAALEKFCGPMDLPEPAAGPCELDGELTRPTRALAGIETAIQNVGAAARTAALGPAVDPYTRAPVPYDPTAIYVLKRPFGGFEALARVVDAAFEEGRLQSLVGSNWAASLTNVERGQAALDAKFAARKLEADAAAAAEAKRKAEQDALQAKMNAEDRRTNPRMRWDDSMAVPDPNERSNAESAASRHRNNPSGPAAEVASDRAAIEKMVGA